MLCKFERAQNTARLPANFIGFDFLWLWAITKIFIWSKMTKGDKSKYKVNDMTVSNGCVANVQKNSCLKEELKLMIHLFQKKYWKCP